MAQAIDFKQAKHIVVIPAAGIGSRFGGKLPKQYVNLGHQAMLRWTVQALLNAAIEPAFDALVVALHPDDVWGRACLADLSPRVICRTTGGQTRALTVLNTLAFLKQQGATDQAWIWVHDAARPGISSDQIQALHATILQDNVKPKALLLALPVADTLKCVEQSQVMHTVDRKHLWLAQTPQVAPLGLLTQAFDLAMNQALELTDEASALEALGVPIKVIEGSASNFKVTLAADAKLMEQVLMQQTSIQPLFKIGEGMDVHALVVGRPLILGGITIPHSHGLLGHSDADALCHAITDAILGAAGLGDIGRMFPDTDAQYLGADSTVLLAKAYEQVKAVGWKLNNLDATIIAQAPKLAAHMSAIQAKLAQTLMCSPRCINIKAKTNEKLGFLGRQEGIECRATVLLVQHNGPSSPA